MTRPTIAFEFFPPKNETLAESLWQAVPKLIDYAPRYMTVTYGAGGSTKDGTLAALSKLKGLTDIPLASHLTFLSTKKTDLDKYIETLWDMGVHHIVALRGDLPKGASYADFTGEDYYDYTSTFVAALKNRHPFEISVGAYPEKHPDAPSLEADIQALKLKCDAGADRALTQFFFDNDVYYRFVEAAEKAGITTPICPGLIPIHDFKGLCHFAARCQASVPDWLHETFDGLEAHTAESEKRATELLVKQAEDLARNGIKHIHFYAMNKDIIISDAIEALGYSQPSLK